jgi:deoxyribodipyrimidine photo-lyase
MRGLYIFRRDLRYQDNTALYNACSECDEVICLFILDTKQINATINKYFSYNAFAFMLETLIELKKEIDVIIETGTPHSIVKQFISDYKIDCVYMNRDYTPYSKERDSKISSLKINLKLYDDIVLNSPDAIKPYKVYTPYYNVARKIKIPPILKPDIKKIIKPKARSINIVSLLSQTNKKAAPLRQIGGRDAAEKLLSALKNTQKNYVVSRNILSKETSRLSPYIKFGVISIREVYNMSPSRDFTKELFWRDFYIQIAYHFPNVLVDNKIVPKKTGTYAIDKNFKQIKVKWEYNKKLYNAWRAGKTGIPIVDAAINQLLQTGYMHNRCRMIVASVFTKLFHLDWRLGEQFFANNLTDYDPCSNNGGWQWASGTGADAQPYFRIFNPYTQAEKYDSDCQYIKKWCPQYADMTPKEIFSLRSNLFDYEKARENSIKMFANAK